MKRAIVASWFILVCANSLSADSLRTTLSLSGTWQIAEGSMTEVPASFDRTVPVPGLVDLATPAFVEPGPKVVKRDGPDNKDPRRDAFWYRRTFTVTGAIPKTATLKIAKAMFGTRVYLNGQLLGDHKPCFTPGYFDARPALKTGENEIIVRVGADRDAIGRAYPDGFDFEKSRYIPGIFDCVTLILSGTPRIENVQVAPDLAGRQARLRVYLDGAQETAVEVELREAKSGKVAGTAEARAAAGTRELDVPVPVADCHLWSPEDPFLYTVTVRTSGDCFTTRLGMREFRFDPTTRQAMLNGKPYFLRGSNITLYRFFEDSERGELPWQDDWVRTLHRRVKDMHWNCLRYCIGLPPERWYDIADEEGILIQNEFPIWYGGDVPAPLSTDELAAEYADWLRDQWNHPCVAIWDATNETNSKKTADALMRVRDLDLSQRPWDNGYYPPQEPGDTNEQHPYHYISDGSFRPKRLATLDPHVGDGRHAVIVNEYGWLWVNRDGTPTTLTQALYTKAFGEKPTPAQLFHAQAVWLAADTEFWRAHRQAAAVMHFVTLGYSRPDGQTCDHWTQGGVAQLEWEPEFLRYVRDAFAPVGLMVNFGRDKVRPGTSAPVPVILINDLDQAWSGPVTLRLKKGDGVLAEKKCDTSIAARGTTNLAFDLAWPAQLGPVVLEAELSGPDGSPVHSVRELIVTDEPPSLMEQCQVTASSVYQPAYRAENAVDGDEQSYWSSAFQDDAWLAVDLGTTRSISRVNILWENAYAKSFAVQLSTDGQTWKDVYKTDAGEGGTTEIKFTPTETRHIRIVCTKRGTQWGNAIRELDIK